MTKSEAAFLDQMTRKLMVGCADWLLQHPDGEFPPGILPAPYLEHALKRGWVSKRNNQKLTGAGFSVAASFLKR